VSVRLDEYLRKRAAELDALGAPEARLNLEHVAAHRLGVPRLELIPLRSEPLSPGLFAAIEADAVRLAAGEPLQYVLGETPFHGLMLKTDRRALIPRPETEWLVDQVLACGAIWAAPEPAVADVGTGTGCIALALASARPRARVLAVEADPAALELACENRARLGLERRVEMRAGDLLDGVPPGSLEGVVSNPPYIASAVCATLDRHVRDHEPWRALDGGADGLEIIRRLAKQAQVCLKPGCSLWLEIGSGQGAAAAGILAAAGFTDIEIRRDWSGLDRAACGWRR
jgi:release factor glutamine methyltransferase